MIKGQDIICISTSDWEHPWGSKQQIMSRLSNTNRVLYVEYQMSFLHPLRYPYLWRRYLSYFKGVEKKSKHLFIYTPLPLLPFGLYSEIINKINQHLLAFFVKRILDKIEFKKDILWIYPRWSVDLIDKLKAKTVVYHCIDAFANEKQNFIRKRTIESMEERLLRKAQYIFTLSEKLYNRHKEINKNTYYLPSGVDEIFFDITKDAPLCDIDTIPSPRLGVIGIFDGRLDVDLIRYIAINHPDWSIVLIGAIASNIKKILTLRSFRNIHFLGKKDFEKIPYYERKLDVCLIPYKINDFTENISPLKLYEYLALGKPVVSTRLPDLEKYKDVIMIADTKEDFVRDIALSLEEKGNELANKRLKLAQENTWHRRLETVSQLIEKKV